MQFAEPLIGLEIGFEVCQMHVVVTMGEESVINRSKDAGLKAAEIVGRDQIQCRSSFRVVVVMPIGAVPAAAVGDLLGAEAE